jgi:RND family efflux transporter MFP subunit
MKVALKIIIPIAILVFAFAGFKFLGSLAPKPKNQEPDPVVPVVELVVISPEDHSPPVISYGTVQSLFETDLTPQVSGNIYYVSKKFRVGEKIEAGHVLVKIDRTDYKAARATQKANLTVAERTLAEEEIRVEQAAADWKASGRDISKATDFVLRKPQLAAAKASIESAQAAIKKAKADLKRTEVKSPYDAVVTARNTSEGNQASPQTSLGTLVSTDKVKIRLPLTAEQYARVSMSSDAEFTSPLAPGAVWRGKLVRMEPTVDQRNQVMYAVAEVEDPYGDGKPAFNVGLFANASIQAEPITDSYRVPEAAFVNDKFVWVMDDGDELRRVDMIRIHSHDGEVFLKPADDQQGELRVVSRPLSNFRTGMKVGTEDKDPEAK